MTGLALCWAVLGGCAVVALIVGTYEWRDHQRRRAMARHPANALPYGLQDAREWLTEQDFDQWEQQWPKPYDWRVSGL